MLIVFLISQKDYELSKVVRWLVCEVLLFGENYKEYVNIFWVFLSGLVFTATLAVLRLFVSSWYCQIL